MNNENSRQTLLSKPQQSPRSLYRVPYQFEPRLVRKIKGFAAAKTIPVYQSTNFLKKPSTFHMIFASRGSCSVKVLLLLGKTIYYLVCALQYLSLSEVQSVLIPLVNSTSYFFPQEVLFLRIQKYFLKYLMSILKKTKSVVAKGVFLQKQQKRTAK